MIYNIKKLIAVFMATTLIVAGSANYMLVGAEGLPNTGGVPYDEEQVKFILDGNNPEHPLPEVTMGIALEEESIIPPDIPTPDEYGLELDWGDMKLNYIFTTNDADDIIGGHWSTVSFNLTNNKVEVTNTNDNMVSGKIKYVDIVTEETHALFGYSAGILLSKYDSEALKYISGAKELNYTLNPSGKIGCSDTFYIYNDEDLYDKVNAGELEYPAGSIVELPVGYITVEASIVT